MKPVIRATTPTPTGYTARTVDNSDIARYQHIQNGISTAQWHLQHGRINEAAGRIMSVSRALKNACAESRAV